MNYFKELNQKALIAFERFPVTLIWVLLGSFYCMFQVSASNFPEDHYRIVLILLLGVSWLISAQFFSEAAKLGKKAIWLKLLVIIVLVAYYFVLPENDKNSSPVVFYRWFLFFFAGHILVFVAPFLLKWNLTAYWNYLKNISIAIGRSALFSFILYLGLSFALLSLEALFDVHVKGERYFQIFIFCLGIVNTFVYLSDFPKNITSHRELKYNKALFVFVRFILIPLSLLYLLIVYGYSLKIVYLWELPRGWLTNLILVLAILGFIIHLMIDPIRSDKRSRLTDKFYPWFYILMLPLLPLLFVAILRRINEYNFTEPRYFVLLLAIWVSGMLLYFLISKAKQVRLLPISLFVLMVLSSFGPWGAFQVSINAQLYEMEQILQQVKPENKVLSAEDYNRFTSITAYLKDHHELKRSAALIGFNPDSTAFAKDYNLGRKILDSLKIRKGASELSLDDILESKSFYYAPNNQKSLDVDISGYQTFTEVNYFERNSEKGFQLIFTDNRQFRLRKDKEKLAEFPIETRFKAMAGKYENLHEAEPEEFEFNFENEKGEFKFIFTSLSYQIKEGEIDINNYSAYVFLNLKKL